MQVYIWNQCNNYKGCEKHLLFLKQLSTQHFIHKFNLKKINDSADQYYNFYQITIEDTQLIFTILHNNCSEGFCLIIEITGSNDDQSQTTNCTEKLNAFIDFMHNDLQNFLDINFAHDNSQFSLNEAINTESNQTFSTSTLTISTPTSLTSMFNPFLFPMENRSFFYNTPDLTASTLDCNEYEPTWLNIKKTSYRYDVEHKLVILNEEQEKFLTDTKAPAIINGPPGCGKTFLGLQLLLKKFIEYSNLYDIENTEKSFKLLYIAKSKILINKINQAFKTQIQDLSINFENKQTKYSSLNCQANIITYQEFIQNNLSTEDNTNITTNILNEHESYELYRAWLESDEFQKYKENHDEIVCSKQEWSKLTDFFFSKKENQQKAYKEFRIISGYSNYDEYKSKHERQSNFASISDDKRKFLFNYYRKFKNYCKKLNYFLTEFHEINDNQLIQYHFIIVDESQDFSSLQLKSIKKSSSTQHIVWMIDQRQSIADDITINKTFIQNLFYPFKLDILCLQKTYRCSATIMKFANLLIKLKDKVTPSSKKESIINIDEYSLEKEDVKEKVFWITPKELENKEKNEKLNKKLTELKEDVNVCIITYEKYKEEAIEKYGIFQVFTYEEIKGLQYKTVILFKPLEDELNFFYEVNKLLSIDDDFHRPRDSKFNSAFANLFVAATRAIEQLIIFQDIHKHNVKNIISFLKNQIHYEYFKPNINNINTQHSTPAEWNQQTNILKQEGHISQANKITKYKFSSSIIQPIVTEIPIDNLQSDTNYQQPIQATITTIASSSSTNVISNQQVLKKQDTDILTHSYHNTKFKTVSTTSSVPKTTSISDTLPTVKQFFTLKYKFYTKLQAVEECIINNQKNKTYRKHNFILNETLTNLTQQIKVIEEQLYGKSPVADNILEFLSNHKKIYSLIKTKITEKFSSEHDMICKFQNNKLTKTITKSLDLNDNSPYTLLIVAVTTIDQLLLDKLLTTNLSNLETEHEPNVLQHKLIILIKIAIFVDIDILQILLDKLKVDLNVFHYEETVLHTSVKYTKISALKILLKQKHCDVNVFNVKKQTALHIACYNKSIDIIEELLKNPEININLQDDHGITPLHMACTVSSLRIVDLLLKRSGIDINIQNKSGETALYIACKENNLEIIKKLLKIPNIDINIHDIMKITPLHIACDLNNLEIVENLIEHPNLDINFQETTGETALHIACRANNLLIIELLLKNINININVKDYTYGHAALHIACIRKNLKAVKALIKISSIDLNIQQHNKQTSLHIACEEHTNLVIVKELLQMPNIDLSIKDDYEQTVLHVACRKKQLEMVKLLLKKSNTALLNAQNIDRSTILHIACEENCLPIVEMILTDLNIDVNIKDDYNNTALHIACHKNNLAIINAIIKHPSTDLNIKGQNDFTILHIACYTKNLDIVKILLEISNVDINIQDHNMLTPLHIACYTKNLDIVKELLKKEYIDVNLKNKEGATALHFAVWAKELNILKELLNHKNIDINIENNEGYTAEDCLFNIEKIPKNLQMLYAFKLYYQTHYESNSNNEIKDNLMAQHNLPTNKFFL